MYLGGVQALTIVQTQQMVVGLHTEQNSLENASIVSKNNWLHLTLILNYLVWQNNKHIIVSKV